jgi:hypothetical protein
MVRKGRAVAHAVPDAAVLAASINGHAANGHVTNGHGPRIQRREAWLPLIGEGAGAYPGFEVRVWTNHPSRIWGEIQSRDEARMSEALRQLVTAHNGWLDFDGEPYPPADTDEFWTAIPNELAALVILTIERGAFSLPNSVRGSAPQ